MSKPINQQDHNIISMAIGMLHKIGATDREELLALIPGLTPTLLYLMRRRNFVTTVRRDDEVYKVSNLGRTSFGIEVPKTNITPGRLHNPTSPYVATELRPYEGRPGSMDAFALKSFGYRT